MRHTNFWAALAVFSLVVLAGCGGGGGGFAAPSNPLAIMSSTLPAVQSGDAVDFEIPLSGGCSGSGPYVVEVIAGALPEGVGTDQAAGRHHLVGVVLKDGVFNFTIKITDTSCTPFLTAVQAYRWDVSQGPVQIVGANPALIPNASYDDPLKYPLVDALEKSVYGGFMSYKLVVAGGLPPYEISIVDDPSDPDDGGLPTGVSIPVSSTSFTGRPIQVGPGGKPFLITFQVRDSLGATSTRKLQWKVDTPPIILATPALGNGQTGVNFADSVQIVDGVPPFRFELIDDFPTVSNDDIVYAAPAAPTFPSATGFTVDPTNGKASNMLGDGSAKAYPAYGDAGPQPGYVGYGPFPSEGVSMNLDTGGISGLPRRAGTFTMHVHVCSTLVPNERGQHAFKTYTHVIAPSEPPVSGNPAFSLTPAFTEEGVFLPPPTYSSIAEFEAGSGNYNPDSGAPGLQLTGVGGVPADGWNDAPHVHQRTQNFGETPGSYAWETDWDVATLGTQAPPTGITANAAGVIGVTPTGPVQRVARAYLDIYVKDYQLPTGLQNVATRRVGYSVGPDVVILSQSSASNTSTYTYWGGGISQTQIWDDHQQRIRKFKLTGSPSIVNLDSTDMALTHTMPAAASLGASSNPLGDLLSANNLDILRCVVNATGYWDDLHGLNPHGANPGTHASFNRGDYSYYGNLRGYYYGYYYLDYYGYAYGNWQPNVTAVQLPDAEGVTHDPTNGVYANGGRLYQFETATHYGMFVIREDGRIYIPYAAKKATTYEGFGDGATESFTTGPVNSMFRINHMTVSPDGRFAAMKIMKDTRNMYEAASSTKVVLVSLSGEKPFAGSTYKVIDNGVSATGSGNRIQYAASLALTNDHLYFLIGSQSAPNGTSTSTTYMYYQAWSGHFIMRYKTLGGASTASLLNSATGDSAWTQASGTSMQTVYCWHGPNTVSSTTGPGIRGLSSSYGYWPHGYYWAFDGMNMKEQNVAPGPFRVSRDGSTVAFFAAQDGSYYYGTDVYSNYCWVDTGDGARRVTSTRRRHLNGSARGYTIFDGPENAGGGAWGRYQGPTPGVEISDDGTQVAFVYNTTLNYFYGSDSYSIAEPKNYRDNIILTSTTDGWGSYTERDVTQNTFYGAANSTSTSYIKWRFGALTFTEDGTGLVFWAGGGNYYPSQTSYSYQQSYVYTGSFFMHNVSDYSGSYGTKVTSMCSTTEGGFNSSSGATYTNSSPRNPGTGSGVNGTRFGAIHPWGGFISRNRKFLYIVQDMSISSSDATAGQLVGMNIQSANSGSYAGKSNGVAFLLNNWPARRSFLMGHNYYYYNRYYQYQYGYGYGVHGSGCQVMSKDNGWVFWSSNNQYTGPTSTSSSTYAANVYGSYYYGANSYGGPALFGFNADTGGTVAQLDPVGLSAVGGTATSPYGGLNYMEVARDGSKILCNWTPSSAYMYMNQEQIYYVTNIDFSSGSMHASFNRANDSGQLESSNGRASEAMAISLPSQTVYYAYKAGAGNETEMEMVSAKWNAVTKKYDKTAHTSNTGRLHVLFGTR